MTLNKELLIKDSKKIGKLILAFAICSYGIMQIKVVNLGMEPWDTLILGISNRISMDFGKVTQIVGFYSTFL